RRDAEIEQTVAVEVAHGHGLRTDIDVTWRLKGAVPVSLQDAHVVLVSDREIEFAVAVEVADRKRSRISARRAEQGRTERPVGVAEQYDDGTIVVTVDDAFAVPRNRDVKLAVGVEVGSHHGKLAREVEWVADRGEERGEGAVFQNLDARSPACRSQKVE